MDLKQFSSIKVGDLAQNFCIATSVVDVFKAWSEAQRFGWDIRMLGEGSNILFPDHELSGLTVKMAIPGIERIDKNLVRVGAGVNWSSFVNESSKMDLFGIECLAGIPGTVGATPIQNVGAYGQEVKDSILKVEGICLRTGQSLTFSNFECKFGYRTSLFKAQKSKIAITHVTFKLSDLPLPVKYPELKLKIEGQFSNSEFNDNIPSILESRIKSVLELRRKKGMVIDPTDFNTFSLGSFFVNPVINSQLLNELKQRLFQNKIKSELPVFQVGEDNHKISAAWLIEQSGLEKGFQMGNAAISQKHSLAIVNLKSASSSEILSLASYVQKKVKDNFNILLMIEPEIWI